MVLVRQRRFYLPDERMCVLLTQLERRLVKMASERRVLDHGTPAILRSSISSALLTNAAELSSLDRGSQSRGPQEWLYSDQGHRQADSMYS